MTDVYGFIYGIFDDAGICVYVGKTIHKDKRKRRHSRRWPGFKFKVLRPIFWNAAFSISRVEGQVIRAYWRRGQAKENFKRPNPGKRKPCWVAKPMTADWAENVHARILRDYNVDVKTVIKTE